MIIFLLLLKPIQFICIVLAQIADVMKTSKIQDIGLLLSSKLISLLHPVEFQSKTSSGVEALPSRTGFACRS